MTAEREHFVHEPLSGTADTIRLIQVLTNIKDGMLQCAIHNGSTSEEYTALSYTWGPSTNNLNILLNGKPFEVRKNLWDFLLLMRGNYADTMFWIDAICINQEDTAERSEQVQKMADIYASAKLTIVWLGTFVEDTTYQYKSRLANESTVTFRDFDSDLARCLEIFDARAPQEGIEYPRPLPKTLGLPPSYKSNGMVYAVVERLFRHPYWTRLWIIQETKVSGPKIVLFDNLRMTWELLVSTCIYIIHPSKHIRKLRRRNIVVGKSPPFQHLRSYAHDVYFEQLDLPRKAGLSAKKRYARMSTVSRCFLTRMWPIHAGHVEVARLRDQWREAIITQVIGQPELDSEFEYTKVLRSYGDSLCADDRDKIYGLIALQSPEHRTLIPVDYTIDVYDLFYRACKAFPPSNFGLNGYGKRGTQVFEPMAAHLNLTVLDLVFGDPKRRSFVAYVASQSSMEQDVWPDTLHLTEYKDLHGGARYRLTGTCPVCGYLLMFEARAEPKTSTCVVQCNQISSTADIREDSRNHITVYSAGGWISGAVSLRSEFDDQISAIPEPYSTHSKSKLLPLEMLADVLRLHNRYPFRPSQQPGRETRFMRRKLPRQEPLFLVFADSLKSIELGLRPRAYTDELIASLKMNENAQKNFVGYLEQAGFVQSGDSQADGVHSNGRK